MSQRVIICQTCGKSFTLPHHDEKQAGKAKWCSRECFNARARNYKLNFERMAFPEPMSGCWLWTGSVHPPYGYGSFSMPGCKHRAHRAAYMLYKGPVRDDQWVLHRCDNPSCVNPDHLFLGDVRDNVEDMVSKKRHAFGERNGHAKLTDELVAHLRSIYISHHHEFGGAALGRKYGITGTAVTSMVRKRTWRHVV